MAGFRVPASGIALCILLASSRAVHAMPSVAFPFNSQVPTVARVNQLYEFQISGSTFQSTSGNLTYTLSSQPDWLSIDGTTRTLSGFPSPNDQGVSVFTLTATDDTGAVPMSCTLIVSADPAPRLEGSLSGQLALSANLSDAQPPVVFVLPSTSFRFDFSRAAFIDIVPRKLYYYATLSDHTPLPSWLDFDSQNMAFTGTAPELSAYPQSWDVEFIVSDVPGFAGTSTTFTLGIATHDLVFVPQQQTLNIKAGSPFNYTGLQQQLFRNNQTINVYELANATANIPSWLSFNSSTLAIDGITPSNFEDQNITVSVTDSLGDEATAVISLNKISSSVFATPIGTIVAYAGRKLDYHFSNTLFTIPALDLQVHTPSSASWLHFNEESRDLEGTAPTQATSTIIEATLVASGLTSPAQTQNFIVKIEPPPTGSSTSDTGLATRASPTKGFTSGVNKPGTNTHAQFGLSRGVIAAITILSITCAILLIICIILYCRQRRGINRRPKISPYAHQTIPWRTEGVAGNGPTDVEKSGENPVTALPQQHSQVSRRDNPDLSMLAKRTLPWQSRVSRISKATSLGFAGEAAIRGTSEVPDLSGESHALQTWLRDFFTSDELVRITPRSPELSASRRNSRMDYSKHRSAPKTNAEFGRDLMLRKNKHARQRRATPDSPTNCRVGSIASFSTRSTSVLSTRPLDFPEPPTSSSDVRSIFPLTNDFQNGKKSDTIRLVNTSDIISDDRPMDVKRQSFIRARASSGQPNPLFAHGSGALSSHSTKQSGRSSAALSAARSARRAVQKRNVVVKESRCAGVKAQPGSYESESSGTSSAFPRLVSEPGLSVAPVGDYPRDLSPKSSTLSLSISDSDLAEQKSPPLHQHSWVLPGEASPTPPPLFSHSLRETSPGRSSKWSDGIRDQSIMSQHLTSANAITMNPGLSTLENETKQLSRSINLFSADNTYHPMSRLIGSHTSQGSIHTEKAHSHSNWTAETETATSSGNRWRDKIDNSCDEQSRSGSASLENQVKDPAHQGRPPRSDSGGLAFL